MIYQIYNMGTRQGHLDHSVRLKGAAFDASIRVNWITWTGCMF